MTYRVLNLGAGVQSTAVLLLALDGKLPYPIDSAIFADTQWEPREVYDHLDRLEKHAASRGFAVHRVTAGNLRDHALGIDVKRKTSIPFYMAGERAGVAIRQCTRDYKIRPIRRLARRLMTDAGAVVLGSVFGISLDEVQRMRDPDAAYVRHLYPLVEMGWRRDDCNAYLADAGWPAPRSACIGCPYHNDAEWRRLRERPDEWDDAVEFDRRAREEYEGVWDGVPYLHRSRVPLAEADLRSVEQRGQLSLDAFDDECEGMCGV